MTQPKKSVSQRYTEALKKSDKADTKLRELEEDVIRTADLIVGETAVEAPDDGQVDEESPDEAPSVEEEAVPFPPPTQHTEPPPPSPPVPEPVVEHMRSNARPAAGDSSFLAGVSGATVANLGGNPRYQK